jgi:hypothetical protein
MKIFKDTTNWPSGYLLKYIEKLYFVMFGIGLMTGMAIMMAGIASKNNDFEETLLLIGIAIFFLFFLAFFISHYKYKIIPELKRRLSSD